MSIALTGEQAAPTASIRAWAASARPVDAVRTGRTAEPPPGRRNSACSAWRFPKTSVVPAVRSPIWPPGSPKPPKRSSQDLSSGRRWAARCFVPDEMVVGRVGGGWRPARTTLANERVALGSGSAVGEGVESLLATVTAEADLDRLGRLIAEGSACSVLDLRATLRRLGGQDPGAESSVRKLLGVRHRQAVAEFALEALAENALVGGDPAHHEFLLTPCLGIAGGTTQVLLSLTAERLLGLPRS
ncbi:acyl-CoA dehydrogenase family protein [Amycolatopsis sp. QT-25]|uniref:acyl-CoA dehydrogenase family protein n=1 Tax=Amycolatopsis sp. QT-25 TaxID=3034022 RepID=UPI0023EC5D52|nr:acyl-CoA dehydrogenase family protein [Amycolatopsis sp. QT-25]WET81942.1 acyl-CoA dehydrogenase family protein [Amycolatopsis sp. QT-25]